MGTIPCQFCGKEYQSHGAHFREDHPIKCEEVGRLLRDYSLGKLEEETDERVICHLADCKDCMDRLTTMLNRWRREGRVLEEDATS